MPSPTLTRRALIAGTGTAIASAALAVPYVNAAHATETITDRLDRLTTELAQAMGEYQGGKYKVVVEPGIEGDVRFVPLALNPERRVRLAVAEIRTAMSDLGEEDYLFSIVDINGKQRAHAVSADATQRNF